MDIKYIDIYDNRYLVKNDIDIPFDGIFEDSLIHRSNNGFIYVLLPSISGELKFYKIDELLCWYYKKDQVLRHTLIDQFDNPRFKVEHIDGNIENNNVDNLNVIFDIEEWRLIGIPVLKFKYEVSSWGRVRNQETMFLLSSRRHNGYLYLDLRTTDGSQKTYAVHRLVCTAFIFNNLSGLEVNHIDRNKSNNHITNLEVVTQYENKQHAKALNCFKHGEEHYKSKLTNLVIERICVLLLEENGSPKRVLERLESDGINDVSKSTINNIKLKMNYKCISDKYFDRNTFCNLNENKKRYNEDTVRSICQHLVDFDFDLSSVLEYLHSIDVYNIDYKTLYSIKTKRCYHSISDKYF